MSVYKPTRRSSQVVRASSDPLLQKPAAPAPPTTTTDHAAPASIASTPSSSGVSIEYQRQQAKALQQYFRDQKLEATVADSQYVSVGTPHRYKTTTLFLSPTNQLTTTIPYYANYAEFSDGQAEMKSTTVVG